MRSILNPGLEKAWSGIVNSASELNYILELKILTDHRANVEFPERSLPRVPTFRALNRALFEAIDAMDRALLKESDVTPVKNTSLDILTEESESHHSLESIEAEHRKLSEILSGGAVARR